MLNTVLGGKLISELESLKALSAIFELKKTSTNEVPGGSKSSLGSTYSSVAEFQRVNA